MEELTYSQRLTLLHGICLAEIHADGAKPSTDLADYDALDAAYYLASYITFNAITAAERNPKEELTEDFVLAFSDCGFSVSVNKPFSGSIVPVKFYRKNKSVHSIMIEIRRDLYMDEATGKKNGRFAEMRSTITKVLDNLGVNDWEWVHSY